MPEVLLCSLLGVCQSPAEGGYPSSLGVVYVPVAERSRRIKIPVICLHLSLVDRKVYTWVLLDDRTDTILFLFVLYYLRSGDHLCVCNVVYALISSRRHIYYTVDKVDKIVDAAE